MSFDNEFDDRPRRVYSPKSEDTQLDYSVRRYQVESNKQAKKIAKMQRKQYKKLVKQQIPKAA